MSAEHSAGPSSLTTHRDKVRKLQEDYDAVSAGLVDSAGKVGTAGNKQYDPDKNSDGDAPLQFFDVGGAQLLAKYYHDEAKLDSTRRERDPLWKYILEDAYRSEPELPFLLTSMGPHVVRHLLQGTLAYDYATSESPETKASRVHIKPQTAPGVYLNLFYHSGYDHQHPGKNLVDHTGKGFSIEDLATIRRYFQKYIDDDVYAGKIDRKPASNKTFKDRKPSDRRYLEDQQQSATEEWMEAIHLHVKWARQSNQPMCTEPQMSSIAEVGYSGKVGIRVADHKDNSIGCFRLRG